MRAREAHAQLGEEVGDIGHDVGEVVAPAAAQPVKDLEARTRRAVRRLRSGLQRARGLVVMRVHVLTEQHQLLHALAGEATALFQDCVEVPPPARGLCRQGRATREEWRFVRKFGKDEESNGDEHVHDSGALLKGGE